MRESMRNFSSTALCEGVSQSGDSSSIHPMPSSYVLHLSCIRDMQASELAKPSFRV